MLRCYVHQFSSGCRNNLLMLEAELGTIKSPSVRLSVRPIISYESQRIIPGKIYYINPSVGYVQSVGLWTVYRSDAVYTHSSRIRTVSLHIHKPIEIGDECSGGGGGSFQALCVLCPNYSCSQYLLGFYIMTVTHQCFFRI
jgi:hypothetical protein